MNTVYCMMCRTANGEEQTHCSKCGMLLPTHVSFGDEADRRGSGNRPDTVSVDERVDYVEERVNGLMVTIDEVLSILEQLPGQFGMEVAAVERLNRYLEKVDTPQGAHDALWNRNFQGYLQSIDHRESFDRKCKAIVECHPGDQQERLKGFIHRSEILFYNHQHHRSLQLLERALRLSPKNHELLFFIGEKYFLLNQAGRAEEMWRRVLALAPRHFGATLMTGILSMMDGRFEESRNLLLETVSLKTRSILPVLALAALEFQEQNYLEADRYLRLANDLNETVFGHILQAESYSRQNQPRKAILQLERALALEPDDRIILQRLAVFYLKSGYTRRARETFARLSELSPKDAVYSAIAREHSRPEMMRLALEQDELKEPSILQRSVTDLIRRELER